MMSQHVYVYEMSPVDYWEGMTPLGSYFDDRCMSNMLEWRRAPEFDRVLRFLFRTMEIARSHGHWEGDVAHGPYISAVPDSGGLDCALILAWKQSNNGTTYVASQIELPWLAEYRLAALEKETDDA
jgi:hypothetical protein